MSTDDTDRIPDPDDTPDDTPDDPAATAPTADPARSSGSEVRSARRAQREAERAAKAQRKADAARQRAMDAARAGGLFEGMEAGAGTDTDTDAAATTGDTDDTSDGDAASAPGPASSAGTATVAGTPPSREPMDPRRRRVLMTVLSVASVLLVVVAGLATWGYVEAREDTAAEQAVSNAPQAATEAARQIATQMFTYDHRTVDADLGAVRDRLTEPALSEFVEESMPTVSTSAKEHEASVYATVAAAAAEEVTDAEHVTVLVMLNRMVSTKDSPEAAASASRLRLHMVEVDGTWKLGELVSL